MELKNDVPFFTSLIFDTFQGFSWRHVGGRSGSIRNNTDDKPGSINSVDQLISTLPGLVPPFLGRITSVRTWVVQFMVQHYRNVVYVQLISSKSQEEN